MVQNKEEIREQIKKLGSDTLTIRERLIMEFRFGLTDGKEHTLEETGKLFGLTRERIRQIESKAIQKILDSQKVAAEPPIEAQNSSTQ